MTRVLSQVDQLIADHIHAFAEHERLFRLNDYGLAEDAAVEAAVEQIDAALIALCRARPTTPADRRRRRDYLAGKLAEATDGCKDFAEALFEALLAEDEPQETPMDLLRQWQEAYDTASEEENKDEHERHISRCGEIEAAVSAIPATSAQDLAAKLLIVTSYGDFMADEPLIAEAKALVGSEWDTHVRTDPLHAGQEGAQ